MNFRYLSLLFLLLFSFKPNAQNIRGSEYEVNISLSPIQNLDCDDCTEYQRIAKLTIIANTALLSNNSTFTYLYTSKYSNDLGSFYNFSLQTVGIEVYSHTLQILITKTGNIPDLIFTSIPFNTNILPIDSIGVFSKNLDASLQVESKKWIYFKENNRLNFVQLVTAYNANKGLKANYIYSKEGDLLLKDLLTRKLTDTLLKGFKFNPDPLTKAKKEYGGLLVDNNDKTNSELDALRDSVQFYGQFDSFTQKFVLKSDYLLVTECSNPNVPPVTNVLPNFYYDRSQSGFEDVMVFSTVQNYRDYINSLGYVNYTDSLLWLDTHALNGDDNSFFLEISGQPRLLFGTGGVDDAEDADVIVHEFSHYLNWMASGNSALGLERRSLEEGVCDYLAGSYSNAISNYNSTKVYTWDGNETWQGRKLNANLSYVADINSNIYNNAQIFSQPLWDLELATNRALINKLVLGSLPRLVAYISMKQALYLFLATDDMQNAGINKNLILQEFAKRKIYPEFVGIKSQEPITRSESITCKYVNGQLIVFNTDKIASNQLTATISDNQGRVLVNKIIVKSQLANGGIEIGDNLAKGVYYLKIVTNDQILHGIFTTLLD
ncbi:MAG: hypothetical protein SGJ04_05280 [Bacteroidota bacterium]|nr:hypothetical protein [Bacteroidota bacterium]